MLNRNYKRVNNEVKTMVKEFSWDSLIRIIDGQYHCFQIYFSANLAQIERERTESYRRHLDGGRPLFLLPSGTW